MALEYLRITHERAVYLAQGYVVAGSVISQERLAHLTEALAQLIYRGYNGQVAMKWTDCEGRVPQTVGRLLFPHKFAPIYSTLPVHDIQPSVEALLGGQVRCVSLNMFFAGPASPVRETGTEIPLKNTTRNSTVRKLTSGLRNSLSTTD